MGKKKNVNKVCVYKTNVGYDGLSLDRQIQESLQYKQYQSRHLDVWDWVVKVHAYNNSSYQQGLAILMGVKVHGFGLVQPHSHCCASESSLH